MADDTAPPTDAGISTPYLVQQQDGSTATYYVHTDRPPSQGDVAGYAASQGQNFAGFPEPPAEPAPAAAPEAPSYAQRAWNVIAPQRSFLSQAPSIGGAVAGGLTGAAYGAPFFPPFGSAVGGLVGAGLGAMGGEAAQYGGEQALGAEPAEAGTFGQRVGSAGVRGVVGEATAGLVRAPVSYVASVVRPVAEAAASDVGPILTGTAERVAEGRGAAAQLAARAKNALIDWWEENAAGKAPGEIADAWGKMKPEEQLQVAGENLPHVQNVMSTLAKGATPWSEAVGPYGKMSVAGGVYHALTSGASPRAALATAAVPALDVAQLAGQKALSAALRTPAGVDFLARLPAAGQVAGPLFQGATRLGTQSLAAEDWMPATQVAP